MVNWFLVAVAILQVGAAIVYFKQGQIKLGLMILFVAAASMTNAFIK
jgi:hypothetical protein